MKKTSTILNWKEIGRIKTDRPNWIEWLIPALVAVFFVFAYSFIDLTSLTGWSCLFLDSIVDGNLWGLYDIIHQNPLGTYHDYMGYNFFILIPLAVWNLPLWIAERFFAVDILHSTLALGWSKLFLYVCTGLLVWMSKNILKIFYIEKGERIWAYYLMLTSPAIFLEIYMAGQNDVPLLFFATTGVWFLLKGKQKLFILMMVLSMATKPFFIFPYVAVILLIEKNIFKIIIKSILPLLPMFGFILVFWKAPMYSESIAGGSLARVVEGMVSASLPVANTFSASLFLIALLVLYVLAYCHNNPETRKEYILYMMLTPTLMYLCFCNYEFYRLIYFLPFMFILFKVNKDIQRLNLLLILCVGLFGTFMAFTNPIIGGPLSGDPALSDVMMINEDFVNSLGIHGFSAVKPYGNIGDFLMGVLPFSLYLRDMIAGAFIILLLVFSVINYPAVYQRLAAYTRSGDYLFLSKPNRWLYWVQPIFGVILTGILLLCYRQVIW